jgi:hypothetical protein
LVLGALVLVLLAAHVAAHVALVVGLAQRQPRWRAAAGLALSPLAAYWGYREGMRVRAWMWVGTVGAYALTVAAAGLR